MLLDPRLKGVKEIPVPKKKEVAVKPAAAAGDKE